MVLQIIIKESHPELSEHYSLIYSKINEIETMKKSTTHTPEIYSKINEIGHELVKSVEINIGESKIDKQYNTWMNIWNELDQVDKSKNNKKIKKFKNKFKN